MRAWQLHHMLGALVACSEYASGLVAICSVSVLLWRALRLGAYCRCLGTLCAYAGFRLMARGELLSLSPSQRWGPSPLHLSG